MLPPEPNPRPTLGESIAARVEPYIAALADAEYAAGFKAGVLEGRRWATEEFRNEVKQGGRRVLELLEGRAIREPEL